MRILALLLLLPLPALAESWRGPVRVVDGDTVRVAGERLRLRSVDAFETRQTCGRHGHSYPCGLEAKRALVRLTKGREAICRGATVDRYRRPLVRCQVGQQDLGRQMVRFGWAVPAYGRDYRHDAEVAHATRSGAWAGRFAAPTDWRHHRRRL